MLILDSLFPFDNRFNEQGTAQPQKSVRSGQHPIYFATTDAHPSSERRLVSWPWLVVGASLTLIGHLQFIADTLIIFAAFQNLMKTARAQGGDWSVYPLIVAKKLVLMLAIQGPRTTMPEYDSETCSGLCEFH